MKRTGLGVSLDVANAVFARLGVGFHTEFLQANEEFFQAKVEELDFSNPETLKTINRFVSKATNEKINDLLNEPIEPTTVMFLINCVYFKGEWSVKFDKSKTEDLPFAGVGDVPTMYRKGMMVATGRVDLCQCMSLPFGSSGDVRMLSIVPSGSNTVDDVLASLDAEMLTGFTTSNYKREGQLWLPRINVTYDASLNKSLSAIGMEQAFGDADFSGMRQTPPAVFIEEVKHRTTFAVNEEGAEGTAATAVRMGLESLARPFEMRFDRPFVTFVSDSVSNTVLFAGVITDPTK